MFLFSKLTFIKFDYISNSSTRNIHDDYNTLSRSKDLRDLQYL